MLNRPPTAVPPAFNEMKVTILGATGGSGRALVEQALAAGHDVTAFGRDAAKLAALGPHSRLTTVQGDAADAGQIERAVAGADAVISALGPTRTSARRMLPTAAAHVIAAMKKHGVRRLIWQTGAGVRAQGDAPSAVRGILAGLIKLLSPGVLEDSERAFAAVQASDVDWTVVRVPRLNDGPRQGGFRAALTPPGPRPVSRADAAAFMLEQIDDPEFVRRAPMLGY